MGRLHASAVIVRLHFAFVYFQLEVQVRGTGNISDKAFRCRSLWIAIRNDFNPVLIVVGAAIDFNSPNPSALLFWGRGMPYHRTLWNLAVRFVLLIIKLELAFPVGFLFIFHLWSPFRPHIFPGAVYRRTYFKLIKCHVGPKQRLILYCPPVLVGWPRLNLSTRNSLPHVLWEDLQNRCKPPVGQEMVFCALELSWNCIPVWVFYVPSSSAF